MYMHRYAMYYMCFILYFSKEPPDKREASPNVFFLRSMSTRFPEVYNNQWRVEDSGYITFMSGEMYFMIFDETHVYICDIVIAQTRVL